jgi:hypothetical protein
MYNTSGKLNFKFLLIMFRNQSSHPNEVLAIETELRLLRWRRIGTGGVDNVYFRNASQVKSKNLEKPRLLVYCED